MSKKRMVFPMEVQSGPVIVKIYKAENKGRDSFTVSYFADGKRKLKMFADFDEAYADAKSKAVSLSKGELDVLHLGNAERIACVHAVEAVRPTGLPLELAATEYAEAWKVLGGKASVIEAAKEFARRHLHTLPDKMLPDAVKEMLEAKEREGASKVYMKVLRFYLGQMADAFHCQLRSVTTGQLADFFRNMEVFGRSKNNARQTVGAFFKYCKERAWLPKDHDGISMVPKFKEKAGDIEIFTPQEIAHFLTCSRPELVPFLAIGAFAGLRSEEIERLDWIEIHLADRFIEVKAAVWKKNALRHSFISYRVADTQNVNQSALECGHSPAVIFKHCRELVRLAEAKKWFGIEPDADGKVTVIPKANEAAVAVA